MRYSTKFYKVYSSLFFEKLEELRYKDLVKAYFTITLANDESAKDKFEIYDALIALTKPLKDPGFYVFKIEGPYTVSVYRWNQEKPIITVTINN